MISSEQIRAAVTAYLARHPDETGRLAALTATLTTPGDLTSRKTFTGHVTCSAIVCDPAGRVLRLHHHYPERGPAGRGGPRLRLAAGGRDRTSLAGPADH